MEREDVFVDGVGQLRSPINMFQVLLLANQIANMIVVRWIGSPNFDIL